LVSNFASAGIGRDWFERHHCIGDGIALNGLGIARVATAKVSD
jgi:hypothetical protein